MDLFFFGGGFEILFSLAFFAVLAVILVTAVRGLLQWNQNNHSPRLTVPAVVAAKRTATTHSHHNTGGAAHVTSSTTYYATFQVESGDRMELRLSGAEYGMLAEGDRGRLTFQSKSVCVFELFFKALTALFKLFNNIFKLSVLV